MIQQSLSVMPHSVAAFRDMNPMVVKSLDLGWRYRPMKSEKPLPLRKLL